MTATNAQAKAVRHVYLALKQHAPQGALKSLTPAERAAVLTDWLTFDVGLGPTDLELLSNALGRQAHMMMRGIA